LKKWGGIAAAVAILIIVVVASIASGGPRGENVYVEPVGRRDIRSVVSAPGEIDPKVKVNISAHVIGKIERLHIREGDTVQRGDRLVELEKENFVAQRDRMRSEVANRRIEVSRARTNLANAELQFKRARQLREQGIQAEDLFDQASLALENARSALASAEEAVRQAAAGLTQAEADLARTTIHSPMSGKIVSLSAQEGEVVVTGTMNNPGSVIAVLADLSEILVQAQVGETEITRVSVGQAAEVRTEATAEKTYSGRVLEIGSSAGTKITAGSGQRYFNVKVGLLDADEQLRPGMTAQVEILTESLKNVIAVPVQAVVEKKGEEKKSPHVFLIADGKAKAQDVTTGISDDTHVVILSGLKEGDRTITGPFRTLRKLEDGSRVQESEEKKERDDGKKEKESDA
jgi:HlyD family secretion protein